MVLVAVPQAAVAQDDLQRQLRESQRRLEQIRAERRQLQQEMQQLSSKVHTTSSELENIEQQVSASAQALGELEFQSQTLNERVDTVTQQLGQTRERLHERREILRKRLRSIYKRGPLHAVRVLFTARSFSDLFNRYKYLHLIALHDRMLIREIGRLENDLVAKSYEVRASLRQLERLRADKSDELAQLQYLEEQQEETLLEFQQREQRTQGRIETLEQDEARLSSLITRLERDRMAEERRRAASGSRAEAAAISTSDMGSLDWPVEGRVVYQFGPERRPNGVVLRWNGIGIGAAPGTPVRVVEAGRVMMAGPFEGYGPTVIVSHGSGFYTLYHYLNSITVRNGQQLVARDVIGTVGGQGTAHGPHVEFQVRAPVEGGLPEPVDPLTWLRSRSQ